MVTDAKEPTPPEHETPTSAEDAAEFARRVSVSMVWVALGTIISKLIRVTALFVVLDLITEADLGVAQIALTVFVMLQSLTELGLGAALVQTKKVRDEDLAALFWISIAASVGLYVVVFGLSYAFAAFYEHPVLAPLIQVQGLGVICFSLFVVPKSLLLRDLKMGRVTLAENLAGGLSAVVMMILAAAGLGIWSIIVGEVSSRFIEMVIYQSSRPYFPRFVWAPRRIRHLLSFGLYNTGSRFLGRFYTEVDYLVIGKVFTDTQTGLYAFAFRTVDDLVKALTYVVTQVAYPTFAKLQDDKVALKNFLFGITRGSSLFVGTLIAFVFVFIEPVLQGLGYTKWLPAVELVRLFSVIGLLRSVLPIVHSLINARGDARYMLIYSAVLSITLPIAFLIGAQISYTAVAWAWLIVLPVVSLMAVHRAARLIEISMWQLLRGVTSGFVFPIVLILALELVRYQLSAAGVDPGPIAIVGLILAVTAGGGFAWRYEKPFIDRVFRKKKKALAPPDAPKEQGA